MIAEDVFCAGVEFLEYGVDIEKLSDGFRGFDARTLDHIAKLNDEGGLPLGIVEGDDFFEFGRSKTREFVADFFPCSVFEIADRAEADGGVRVCETLFSEGDAFQKGGREYGSQNEENDRA